MQTRPYRRLSAILAADVAGYSRLMHENETATLEDLRRLRTELFEPLVEEAGGTVIKRMGDGWLVEFNSAASAVECAFGVQRGLRDDPRIRLRIGIHIGDIVHQNEDIFGDGVNIAARLQEAVEPGGVAVSEATHNSVRSALTEQFQDAGTFALKNIDGRQRIFVWNGAVRLEADAPAAMTRPAVLVLPLTAAGTADAGAFAQGLGDTLFAALSRFSWFIVLPRNAGRGAADEGMTPDQMHHTLGASYIFDGGLRTSGNRVRVNVTLQDAVSGDHLWSGQFDGQTDDPFEMEDRISRSLLAELLPRLLGAEARRVAISGDGSPWDLVMRGRNLLWTVSREDVEAAQELFRRAIALDPERGVGQADLAMSCVYQRLYGWGAAPEELAAAADTAAARAVRADDGDAWALASAAFAALLTGRSDDAQDYSRRAIRANPYLAIAHAGQSLAHFQQASYSAAMTAGDYALDLSPQDPLRSLTRSARGMYFLMLDDTEQLEANARALIRDFPGMPTGYRQLAVACVKSGQTEEAARIVREDILRLLPGHRASQSGRQIPFGPNDDARNTWVDLLVQAGLPR